MKNKRGFTLAELSLSLAIVGVVSAILIPTLMENTQTAQVGPKLAKTAAAFEQGVSNMLNANNITRISDFDFPLSGSTNGVSGTDKLMDELSDYIIVNPTGKSSQYKKSIIGCEKSGGTISKVYRMADGTDLWTIGLYNPSNISKPAHKTYLGQIYFDINGQSTKPNKLAEDVFVFAMYDDGSLRPLGASDWLEGTSDACSWKTSCKVGKKPSNLYACTGHIFENNLRVLYK